MLLLTAPSKTQGRVERHHPLFTIPPFLERSRELIALLSSYSENELSRLMNISAALAASTFNRIRTFALPFTPANSHQAIFTFQGDAYASLTPADYSTSQLAHAQRHLLILSGLYGVLRPLDLMARYRLEMGLKLSAPTWRNLYQFWSDQLTAFINGYCRSLDDPTVINLASAEYSRVIDLRQLTVPMVTIVFQQPKGDGWVTIPIHAKRARGLMVHQMITRQLSHVEQLRDFQEDGYRLVAELSTDRQWLFRQCR